MATIQLGMIMNGVTIVDMFAHWRYVLDNLFGEVQSASCLGTTHITERIDEQGSSGLLPGAIK